MQENAHPKSGELTRVGRHGIWEGNPTEGWKRSPTNAAGKICEGKVEKMQGKSLLTLCKFRHWGGGNQITKSEEQKSV